MATTSPSTDTCRVASALRALPTVTSTGARSPVLAEEGTTTEATSTSGPENPCSGATSTWIPCARRKRARSTASPKFSCPSETITIRRRASGGSRAPARRSPSARLVLLARTSDWNSRNPPFFSDGPFHKGVATDGDDSSLVVRPSRLHSLLDEILNLTALPLNAGREIGDKHDGLPVDRIPDGGDRQHKDKKGKEQHSEAQNESAAQTPVSPPRLPPQE